MNHALRLALALSFLTAGGAHAANISLFDWAYNIDGVLYDTFDDNFDVEFYVAPGEGFADTLPSVINDGGFDYSSPSESPPGDDGFDTPGGLGRVIITITGAGAHSIGLYLDHEVQEAGGSNVATNEFGWVTNANQAAPGQSWEIDNPGSSGLGHDGDILDNFFGPLDGPALDNMALVDGAGAFAGNAIDIAMAMDWDFVLDVGEVAVIEFLLDETAPISGLYLGQRDPITGAEFFMSSGLNIFDPSAAPEPATLVLVAGGLLVLARRRRRAGC